MHIIYMYMCIYMYAHIYIRNTMLAFVTLASAILSYIQVFKFAEAMLILHCRYKW